MKQITKEQVRAVRAELLPPNSIATVQDCLAAVERLGFVWPFTPGTELLPAIFPAMVAESEDQKWHRMWDWKDDLSASRQAYYGKVATGKPTFVSHEWLAVFYALTGNTGDLEDDLEHAGETLRLHDQAPKVCRYLQEYGPTGTRTLIAKLTDGTPEMKKGLEKAIEQLDTLMLITKTGTEGGNSIANMWDLFPRFHPEAVDAGTELPTRQAAVKLFEHFFVLTPAITERNLPKLFLWNVAHQERAIAKLKETGYIEPCLLDGKPALKLTAW